MLSKEKKDQMLKKINELIHMIGTQQSNGFTDRDIETKLEDIKKITWSP